MKFRISRAELLAALYLSQGIVERRITSPVLANVLLESGDNTLKVVATDREMTVERRCPAQVDEGGAIATGARKLYDVVRELPEGEISIQSLPNDWIEISQGRTRFRMVGTSAAEFPAVMHAPAAGDVMSFSPAVLEEMLERTVFASSTDEARSNLNGLFFESVEAGRLLIVATDGHRLAMVERRVEGGPLEKGIIVPRKAVNELRKVLESASEEVVFAAVGGVAHVSCGPMRMSVRLVEGEFPDYRLVVPSSWRHVLSVDVLPFLAALRRVAVVSREGSHGVRLRIEPGAMQLSSNNPDVGEASDEIEIEYTGEPLSISFNARYLTEVLAVLPAGTRVELGLNDESGPGMVQDLGDPDYRYIVMPMRL